jgi:PAS domain S-box-containing protein
MAAILVVEDRSPDRELLSTVLSHGRHRVLEAADGAEALRLLRAEHPDLLISDILLPKMDGYELVRQMRLDPAISATSVIFYTAAFNEQEARNLAQECGVSLVLSKPTDPKTIIEKVTEVLKGKGAQVVTSLPTAFEEKHQELLVHKLMRQVEELRQSEERFRLLVDGVKDYAIFMLDPAGNVVSWNDGAQRIKGWTAEEIIGQHFSRFYPAETAAAKPQQGLDRAAAQGRYEEEGWRLRKDGSRFLADVIITALHDEYGRLRGFAKVTRDITERQRQEDERNELLREQQALTEELTATNEELATQAEELTNQKEELERLNNHLQNQQQLLEGANEELEAFSFSVSHDLKTPVRIIEGFCRMLMGEHADQLDAEGLRQLKVITDNTQRMRSLIDDLLALARLGRIQIKKSVVNLAGMARQVFEQLRAEAAKRNLQLILGDLPPAWGDQSLLYQVMQNLLSNAVKFTSSRETAIIEVGGRTEGKENIFYVKDNGAGFDERYGSSLFRPFQRLHICAEFEGTGIGLSIVQRIIQRHGGRVWAEGKVNEGATFYCVLPNE